MRLLPRKEIRVIISCPVYLKFRKFLIIRLFVVLLPALLGQITSCIHIVMDQVVKVADGIKIAIGGTEKYGIIGAGGLWPG